MEFYKFDIKLIIYLYYNGMHTTAAVFSIHIVLHPTVAQFVTRLCTTYRKQGSDLDTLQADVECDKSVPVPN